MLSFSLSDEIVIPAQLQSGSMLTTSKEFDAQQNWITIRQANRTVARFDAKLLAKIWMTSSDHNHIHAFWCGLSVLLLTDMIEVVVIDCRFCLTMIQPSWCWWCLQSTTSKTISNYQKFADCQAEVRLVTSWGGSFPVTSLATTRGGSRQVLQRHGSKSRQKRNCRSKEKKRNIYI